MLRLIWMPAKSEALLSLVELPRPAMQPLNCYDVNRGAGPPDHAVCQCDDKWRLANWHRPGFAWGNTGILGLGRLGSQVANWPGLWNGGASLVTNLTPERAAEEGVAYADKQAFCQFRFYLYPFEIIRAGHRSGGRRRAVMDEARCLYREYVTRAHY